MTEDSSNDQWEQPQGFLDALSAVKAPPQTNRMQSPGMKFEQSDLRSWLADFLPEVLQEYRQKTCVDFPRSSISVCAEQIVEDESLTVSLGRDGVSSVLIPQEVTPKLMKSRSEEHVVKVESHTTSPSRASFRLETSSDARRMEKIRETIASYRSVDHRMQCFAKVWEFLENPFSSPFAWYYSTFVSIFVVASVTISVVQTIPDFAEGFATDNIAQVAVEMLFLTELIVRFVVCPNRLAFWMNFFNYVDLVSIAPAGIRIYVLISDAFGSDAESARHLLAGGMAMVPVLRLLKITRRFEKFQLLLAAFQIAVEALPVLLYTSMLICLMFSTLIHVVEEKANEQLRSFPEAMWFTVVTMTTVGYGDRVPSTPHGHAATCGLMVVSALYMAMPIGIVGNAFSQVWGDRDRLLLMQRLRDAFLQGGFTPHGISEIMRVFDQDGNGELDVEEFQVMLKAMHINISENRVYKLFNILDKSGQGVVSVGQFMKGIFPNYVAAMRRSPRVSMHSM